MDIELSDVYNEYIKEMVRLFEVIQNLEFDIDDGYYGSDENSDSEWTSEDDTGMDDQTSGTEWESDDEADIEDEDDEDVMADEMELQLAIEDMESDVDEAYFGSEDYDDDDDDEHQSSESDWLSDVEYDYFDSD